MAMMPALLSVWSTVCNTRMRAPAVVCARRVRKAGQPLPLVLS
jgi:hypothetical protein